MTHTLKTFSLRTPALVPAALAASLGDANGQTQLPAQDNQPQKKHGGFQLPGLPF